MNFQKSFSKDFLKIIAKAVENKIYGSVEIYFEAGSVTQITQRIINKVQQSKREAPHKKAAKPHQLTKEIPSLHPTRSV